MENRARLLLEVITAVCEVWPNQQVGVRISPLNSYNSMRDSDPVALTTWLAKRLNDFNLAYLHVMRSDFFQQQSGDVLTPPARITKVYWWAIWATALKRQQRPSAQASSTPSPSAPFLANPDLPERFKTGATLNTPDQSTFTPRVRLGIPTILS